MVILRDSGCYDSVVVELEPTLTVVGSPPFWLDLKSLVMSEFKPVLFMIRY